MLYVNKTPVSCLERSFVLVYRWQLQDRLGNSQHSTSAERRSDIELTDFKSNLFASTKYKRKTVEKHKVNTQKNQPHTDYEC